MINRSFIARALFPVLLAALFNFLPQTARAADHGDAPNVSGDQAADLADLYFFLDPNDNTKVIMIATMRGFIVPSEAVNFAIFDPNVRFTFGIENTGDAAADQFINVQFDKRTADPGPTGKENLQIPKAQNAMVTLPGGKTFTAPVLNPSLGTPSPTQNVTTNANGTGVDFFAGEVDDPFFFDIPGFSRFVASVRNGSPDASQLTRGRDSFAGYNIMAIAMRMPVAMIKGTANVIGLDVLSRRPTQTVKKGKGIVKGTGGFVNIDRLGNPAVNVALIPFNRKDEYNSSSTQDDAAGKFKDDIVKTLQELGTSQANIDVLAGVAVLKGDFLHLDVSKANTGTGGGTNGPAAFPNGRRLKDDVIDTLLSIITNGGITTGDNVNANDVALSDTFPFLAPTQQPRTPGTIDDNTRN